jgi:hypothetical protein
MNKIILIDWSWFIHSSIFSKEAGLRANAENGENRFIAPSTYTAMSALISVLRRIGLGEEDKVILCGDGRNSWRKQIETAYKEGRQEKRDASEYIDWDYEFNIHNKLIEKIRQNLFFYMIIIPEIEADDIIAELTRAYSDREVIIASPDKDFEQLLSYDHVKLFNPMSRGSIKSCPYRILDLDRTKEKEKAYNSLMKKVKKETTDNLVTDVITEKDYDKRLKCVTLLELPDFVKAKIKPYIDKIKVVEKTNFDIEEFSNGIQKKLEKIFETDSIITYEYCKQLFAKRKLKKNRDRRANGLLHAKNSKSASKLSKA